MRFLDISCVRKDSMEKREQYKRLIMFLNSTVIILLQTAIFAFVWYRFYANDQEIMMKVFFRRGNYVVMADSGWVICGFLMCCIRRSCRCSV